jgi:hypothetical protein
MKRNSEPTDMYPEAKDVSRCDSPATEVLNFAECFIPAVHSNAIAE